MSITSFDKISFFKKPTTFLYGAHFLSSWGDRMWTWATGIYLFALDNGSFRLASIFGFLCGTCVVLFGGIIGNWVDKSLRLRAVKISLFIQNFNVSLAALSVFFYLKYCNIDVNFRNQSDVTVKSVNVKSHLHYLWEAAIIILGVIALLASTALKISIEKDWIVIVSGNNKSNLANLNAVVRSIDLTCNILAPVVVGCLMSLTTLKISAIFIACWNIFSLILEYILLSKVYYLVPRLAYKIDNVFETEIENVNNCKVIEMEKILGPKDSSAAKITKDENEGINYLDNVPLDEDNHSNKQNNKINGIQVETSLKKSETSCFQLFFGEIIVLITGWKIYVKQSVFYAGLALASLYMTVLGFDMVTIGYIYSQNVPEYLTAIIQGFGGSMGITGAFLFTKLRKRFGLERTGQIGFNGEVICLSLSVLSIFLPGTAFKPSSLWLESTDMDNKTLKNCSIILQNNITINSNNNCSSTESYVSISVFLLGIVLSRIGLWIADLVITQLIQENVIETERGIFNGVQNSLNNLIDMLKFALVFFLHKPQVFGYMIILSYLFVSSGVVFFSVYVCKRKKTNNIISDKFIGNAEKLSENSQLKNDELNLETGPINI